MPARKAVVSEADVKRVIRAASQSGLEISEVIMSEKNVRLVFNENKNNIETDKSQPEEWPELQ